MIRLTFVWRLCLSSLVLLGKQMQKQKKRLFTEKENYDYQNYAINYGFHHFNIPTSTGDRNPRRVDANMHFGAEVQNIFVSCCHGNNSHA